VETPETAAGTPATEASAGNSTPATRASKDTLLLIIVGRIKGRYGSEHGPGRVAPAGAHKGLQ
jgi:hypothetical protein